MTNLSTSEKLEKIRNLGLVSIPSILFISLILANLYIPFSMPSLTAQGLVFVYFLIACGLFFCGAGAVYCLKTYFDDCDNWGMVLAIILFTILILASVSLYTFFDLLSDPWVKSESNKKDAITEIKNAECYVLEQDRHHYGSLSDRYPREYALEMESRCK